MRSRFLAAFVTAGLLACGSAQATSIGVFFAPDGTDCDGTAVAFAPFLTYFGAVLGGDAAQAGITGAEFRVDGYDPAWFNTVTPSPTSNLALGNPIAGGCNIAFPACQSGSNSFVLLYTVQSIALTPPGDRVLAVKQHTTPSNVNFQCPLVTLCDQAFTLFCVQAGEGFLNHSVPCTVGVEQKSWSEIKRLFD